MSIGQHMEDAAMLSLPDDRNQGREKGWDGYRAVDPTRPQTIWNVYGSTMPYVLQQLDHFLLNYNRDLLQSQPNHIELFRGEEDTLLDHPSHS
jgi:hypothetical protein